jgi:hypothetical protein
MNWGHQLKELITRNWREKIISLLLAFLFWFMIKAQDVRYTQPYMAPAPVRITPPASSPAPSQLAPVLPPPSEAPSQLEPVVTPPPATPGLSRAAGL